MTDHLRSAGRSAAPGHHKLERNDPCWCGSGKKYKQFVNLAFQLFGDPVMNFGTE